MTDNERKVIEWIQKNYDITQIEIVDYTLPHSKIVKSKNHEELLVYWDIIEEKIAARKF